MTTTMNPTAATPTPGCWQNFTGGVSKAANWGGRQVSTVASAVWAGIQKIGHVAAAFFQKVAVYLAIGGAAALAFVKLYAVQLLIGGTCLGAGIGLGLLIAHLHNKQAAPQEHLVVVAGQIAEAQNTAAVTEKTTAADTMTSVTFTTAATEEATPPTTTIAATDGQPAATDTANTTA